MKKYNVFIFIALIQLFVSCASSPQQINRINDQLSFKEIAEDTYVVTDETYHYSNILVSRMPDGSVVIASSPFETEGTESLMRWIKKELKPKRVIAINTHFHADGTGGNEAYKNHGVVIWASERTKNFHQKLGEARKPIEARNFSPELQARIMKRKIVPAPNTFKEAEGLTLKFKDGMVKVIWPGPAHTKDNVVVYLPKRKVLFGGCMIKAGNNLGNLADADIEKYAASTEALLSLDVNVVIPGHGHQLGGKELIQNTLRLAQEARRNL